MWCKKSFQMGGGVGRRLRQRVEDDARLLWEGRRGGGRRRRVRGRRRRRRLLLILIRVGGDAGTGAGGQGALQADGGHDEQAEEGERDERDGDDEGEGDGVGRDVGVHQDSVV